MNLFDGDLRVLLQLVAFLALVCAARAWGGGPERAMAGVLGWLWGADFALHPFATGQQALAIGHFAIDLIAAVGAIAIALKANRIYPLWFAAFQLIALFAHLANEATPGVATLAYRILSTGPSYCQIILLAGGIWAHRRRTRWLGHYRSWRTSSLRSPGPMRSDWPRG